MLHTVGIFTVSTVGRPAAGLRIGGTPGLRTERTEKRGGMECARTHFQIIGLVDDTSTVGPKTMEGQDKVLEIHRVSESSSRLLVVADEKQAEASKNGYRVSRNRTSDFNGLHNGQSNHWLARRGRSPGTIGTGI
jgi:hypothetical protein